MASKILLLVLGLMALCYAAESLSVLKKHLVRDVSESSESKEDQPKTAGGSILKKRRRRETVLGPNDSTNLDSIETDKLAKYVLNEATEKLTEEFLVGLLKELADSDTNLTVVGWQQINKPDGTLDELKTIELVIPPKDDDDDIGNFDFDDLGTDDDVNLPWGLLQELEGYLVPLRQLGIAAHISYEEFAKNGESLTAFYFSDDGELYFKTQDDIAVYNKTTITADKHAVNRLLLSLPVGKKNVIENNWSLSLDDDSPIYLAYVEDSYDIPDEILLDAPRITAKVAVKENDDVVPEKLAEAFNEKWSKWEWRTLVNPGNYYLARDVSISLTMDPLSFFENANKTYVVYGREKK